MLSKRYRLPVQGVDYQKARTTRMPLFILKINQSSLPYSRFGVVVSARVSRSAVRRNAIKRSLFNAARAVHALWPIADYVIIATPASAHSTSRAMYDQFISLSTR